MKKEYNWWTDPANAEEVKRISWWNHPENQHTFALPIAIHGNDEEGYTATCNEKTEKYLGELNGCHHGKTKEEAINGMFALIRMAYEYDEECRLNYQRFVPFRKGDWSHIGGSWFTVFGIHVYFRHGKGMKGGWYVPFTKLNISVSSDWAIYRRYKQKK